jgi:serine/threonine-protein kinase
MFLLERTPRSMRTISHYRLEQELGRGGMGRVYKAFDLSLNRTVVLKLLDAELGREPSSRNRFLREARLASALDHPNICTIHEIAEWQDQHFIAMQYLPGKTLKRVIGSRPVPLDTLLPIAIQVADAIATAHSRGIVHRDIKSSNIIVTPRGQAVVLDFGLAKLLIEKDPSLSPTETELTQRGVPLGTPSYMSPEQARLERVDHRSDIFSFGVVLYEMAAGRLPFKGKSTIETMNSVIHDAAAPVAEVNDKIPPQLAAVIDRALAKKPGDRYQSIKDMLEDLRQVALVARTPAQSGSSTARRSGLFGLIQRLVGKGKEGAREPSWDQQSQGGGLESAQSDSAAEFSLTGDGPPRTIAVLPFRNLSGDPASDFYAMSLADHLITELARFKSLVVRPSTAIAKYYSSPVDPEQVGKELEAETILTGNFLKAGDRLRVTAQLIDSRAGQILWSEKVDAAAADALETQDLISQRIIGGLSAGKAPIDPLELLRDEDEDARLDGVRGLKFSRDPRALAALIEALRDPSLKVKSEAVQAITRMGPQATGPVIEILTDAIDEMDYVTARFAAKTLGLIGDESISRLLIELVGSEDSFVVCEAALALGRLRRSEAVPQLLGLLQSPSGNVRFAAAEALGRIRDSRASDGLLARLKDEDEGVRAKARWALGRLEK